MPILHGGSPTLKAGTQVLQTGVTAADKARVQRYAAAENVSLAEVLRMALAEKLASEGY